MGQTHKERAEHAVTDFQPAATCNTVKLKPIWTRKHLHDQQASEPDLKVILELKQRYTNRPSWEAVCSYSRIVKVLWGQWERLEIREQVLSRRWEEEEDGSQRHSPLKQYLVGATMEHLAMDIMGSLPQTRQGDRFVLVITDYCTK